MRELIVKVGKMITDDLDIKLGKIELDESRPEYWLLDLLLTDDMAYMMLKMGRRKPKTAAEIAKKTKWSEAKVQSLLDELCDIGAVEYNHHNADHHKQYVVPVFVVGMAENFMMNKKLMKKYPMEMAKFQDEMAFLPMKGLTHMIPPGSGGAGFHVIPVESAIPKDSESIDMEHLSYWLKKYEDQLVIMQCICRRSMRIQGKGCGELEENVCIGVGDYADYMLETDKEVKKASYDEIMKLLLDSEKNGYMHQITSGDGHEIFAICNCTIGSCFGLRCSQLFNQPNSSASAYRAEVRKENCVACGKCVEVCPAGAARLGQKLCTKHGPIEYPKQPIPDEIKDWGEKYWNYNYREDNQRNCYDTGTSPCKTACPAHVSVQGYINLAAQGRYDEALELIKLDNPFPAICGSICNHRCESACTRGNVDQALAIDEIKKFIAQRELKAEHRFIPDKVRHKGPDEDYTEKMAVIGAGPGGMTAAYYLANMGYPVTVFDKAPAPGGMMMNGIPEFRLEKNVVEAEIEVLRLMGVEFKCGIEVGKDVTLDELRTQGYKAFCVAIGLQNGGKLGVPGDDVLGVEPGIDFMKRVNINGDKNLKGDVVVIGGGNIGADVARTAVRCGAKGVSLFSLEGYDEMPMGFEDRTECEEEGIAIHAGYGPMKIDSKNGKCSSITFKKCLSVKNAEGRFDPRYDENDTLTADCTTVLYCIGQKTDWKDLLAGTKVEFSPRGFAIADQITYQTGEPDIFVCGDALTGQKFVIDAIAGGREVATSMHRFVHEGHDLKISRNLHQFIELDKSDILLPIDSYDKPARQKYHIDQSKVKTFRDEREPFTEEQVKLEASRCLGCGATHVDQNKCLGCGICTTRCRFDAIHLVRNHPEFANYVTADETAKVVLAHGIKRKIKLTLAK